MKRFFVVTIILITAGFSLFRPYEAHAYYSVCASGCDYTTDGTADEVEIQEAIDQAKSEGGGKVVIKSGDYFLTTHLLIDSDNIEQSGEGPATRLINSSTVEEVPNIGARDVITVTAASNVLISNMYLETAGWLIGQPVSVWQGSSNVRINNIIGRNGVDGISVEQSSKIFLDNIDCIGAEHGIGISDSEQVMASNIDVRGTDGQTMRRGFAIWDSQNVELNNFYAEKIDTTGIFIRAQKNADAPGFDTQYITLNNLQIMDPNSTLEWGVRIEARNGERAVNHVQLSNVFAQAYSSSSGDGFSVAVEDGRTSSWIQLDTVRFFARRNPMSVYVEPGSDLRYLNIDNANFYKTSTTESGRSHLENVDMANLSNIVSLSGGGNYSALSIENSRNVTLSGANLKGRNNGGAYIWDFYASGNTNLKYDPENISFVNNSVFVTP